MVFTIEAIDEALRSKNKRLYVQAPIDFNDLKIRDAYISSLEDAIEEEPRFKAKILLSRNFKPEDYFLLNSLKGVKAKYLSKRAERKEKERNGFEISNKTCFKPPEWFKPKDPINPHEIRFVRYDWKTQYGSAVDYLTNFIKNYRTGIKLKRRVVA